MKILGELPPALPWLRPCPKQGDTGSCLDWESTIILCLPVATAQPEGIVIAGEKLPKYYYYLGSVVPKPGGMGGYILPNNLAVSPPIVWEWSTSASPSIIWMGVQLSVNLGKNVFYSCWRPIFCSSPKIGEKKCSISEEDLFFGLHLKSGRKSVLFLRKTFFLVFTWIRGEKVFCLYFSFGLH